MKKKFIALGLGLVFALTACDHGDTVDSPSAPSTSAGPATVAAPAVRVDPAIPATTVAKITVVTTPLGSGAPGAPLDMPGMGPNDRALVLASNAADDIFMGAVASLEDLAPTLTPASTAIVLTALAQGHLPDGFTAASFYAAISQAKSFGPLVTLVTAALQVGTAPVDHPGVAGATLTVLAEAKATLKAGAAGTARVQAASLAPRQVEGPLPFGVLQDDTGAFSVKVSASAPEVSGLKLQNGFPINFGAFGQRLDGSGQAIGIPTASPDGVAQVRLPSSQLLTVLVPDPQVSVPGAGAAWNLTLRRTPAAQDADLVEIIQDSFRLLMDNTGVIGQGCLTKVATATVVSSVARSGYLSQDAAAAQAQFQASLGEPATWRTAADLLLQCARDEGLGEFVAQHTVAALTDSIVPFMRKSARYVGKVVKVIKVMETVYDVSNISAKTFYAFAYWDASTTVGVCQAVDPSTQTLRVANCAVLLELSPSILTLKEGAGQRYVVTARDRTGQPTLVPAGLRFDSDRPDRLRVDTDGTITGLRATSEYDFATVTVSDATTGAQGMATVTVKPAEALNVSLAITPASIALGGSATLNWTTNRTADCTASGAWLGSRDATGSAAVSPASAGSFQYGLACTADGTTTLASVTLTVVAPASAPGVETLDFQSGVWFASNYYQGGATPADPLKGGFIVTPAAGLDAAYLSSAKNVYFSGLKSALPNDWANNPYRFTVGRVDGRTFDALSFDIGLFDMSGLANGKSFRAPQIVVTGTVLGAGPVSFTASVSTFTAYASNAGLTTILLPDSFQGVQQVQIDVVLSGQSTSADKVAITLDNVKVRTR